MPGRGQRRDAGSSVSVRKPWQMLLSLSLYLTVHLRAAPPCDSLGSWREKAENCDCCSSGVHFGEGWREPRNSKPGVNSYLSLGSDFLQVFSSASLYQYYVKRQAEEQGCAVPHVKALGSPLREVNSFYCCFLSLFTSTLEGYYVDDALQGQGIYTYEDGVVLHGTYVDGELNGPAQEYDSDGRLIFKGQYKDNIRHGVCWIYYPVSLTTCTLRCRLLPLWTFLFSPAGINFHHHPAIQKSTHKSPGGRSVNLDNPTYS